MGRYFAPGVPKMGCSSGGNQGCSFGCNPGCMVVACTLGRKIVVVDDKSDFVVFVEIVVEIGC